VDCVVMGKQKNLVHHSHINKITIKREQWIIHTDLMSSHCKVAIYMQQGDTISMQRTSLSISFSHPLDMAENKFISNNSYHRI